MKLRKVSNNISIIENLKEFGEKQDYFHLDIRITSKCNYNCYYCTDMHDNKNPVYDLKIENIGDMIKNISKYVKKPIHIFLYGGEPTLYPDIGDVMNELAGYLLEYNVSVNTPLPILEIQSNLALNKKFFRELCQKISRYIPIVQISGSYHNNSTTFKKFTSKCIILKENNLLGMITFMYNSRQKQVQKEHKIAKMILGETHTEISPLICSSTSELPTEHEESPFHEIEYIFKNENINEMARHSYHFQNTIPILYEDGSREMTSRAYMWLNRSNSFKGFRCDVAKERCIIDYNGDVYKCFNEMFSDEYAPVMNINQKKFDSSGYFKNLKIIECPYDKCFFELEHKKVKSDD